MSPTGTLSGLEIDQILKRVNNEPGYDLSVSYEDRARSAIEYALSKKRAILNCADSTHDGVSEDPLYVPDKRLHPAELHRRKMQAKHERAKVHRKHKQVLRAITLRHNGVPYTEVLKRTGVTSHKFGMTVMRDLPILHKLYGGKAGEMLGRLVEDESLRQGLLLMDNSHLDMQFKRRKGRNGIRYDTGTLYNPQNRQYLSALGQQDVAANKTLRAARQDRNANRAERDRRLPFIDSIISIGNGRYYREVMSLPGISPGVFCNAMGNLETLISYAPRDKKRALRTIASDPSIIEGFFEMDEPYLAEQYDKIDAGQQKEFFLGTLMNTRNREFIAHYALTKRHKDLGLRINSKVAREIKNLPRNLKDYLDYLHLGGLMQSVQDKKSSPQLVLKLFDDYRQRAFGDKSLFDYGQPNHLHQWGDAFMAPLGYWSNFMHIIEATYHLMSVHNEDRTLNQMLGSTSRVTVLGGFRRLPKEKKRYLKELGLGSAMVNGSFGKGEYPTQILFRAFDIGYRIASGDRFSLFDSSQPNYATINRRGSLEVKLAA